MHPDWCGAYRMIICDQLSVISIQRNVRNERKKSSLRSKRNKGQELLSLNLVGATWAQ